ncbi:glycosyltransferase [Halioglobus pacificus]|uniref:Glycosyl transferase n=1 Tax=Parahalioglobus pacificus TaxID=930806 RepID=A0A918XJG8_9GAMM|nr:glycosyltransferase [Halioglobus pacificus]GHD33742.1 glycosyl transferase [Halioglobus pacificus]
MTDYLISIVTPIFNGAKFIRETLTRLHRQLEGIESRVQHIIVDGGSTDGTVQIIRELTSTRSNTIFISEDDNGQSNAMNKGIMLAQGQMLSFLNADDYYENNTLRRVLEIIEAVKLTEDLFIVGNTRVINADKDDSLISINRPVHFGFPATLEYWRYAVFPGNPTAYFYHRNLHQLAGLYNVAEHYAMDYEFLLKSSKYARIIYFDEIWGNFRYYKGTKTEESVTSGMNLVRRQRITNSVLKNEPKAVRFSFKFKEAVFKARHSFK